MGPEVGVSLSRHMRGNFYLVGSGRYAMIFGTEQFDDEDDVFSISEIQMGLEYRRDMCGTAQWFARAAFEGQYWSAAAYDDEEDLGLVGGVLAFGLTR